MNDLNIWLIIAILATFQGFFLAIAIFMKSSSKNTANLFLSLFILLISFSLVGRISSYFPAFENSFLLGGVMDIIIFSYGPLSYFYLKNLFDGKYFPSWKDYRHFIPLAIFLIYFFSRVFFPKQFNNSVFYTHLGLVYVFLELMAIVQNGLYIYSGYKMVNEYEKRFVKKLSFLPQVKYIKIFLAVISLIILMWLYGFASKFIEGLEFSTVFSYNFVWLLISFLSFLFAYFSFFDSDILSIPQDSSIKESNKEEAGKYEQGYFSDDFYNDLKDELEKVMTSESPFLNPKLTLSELAQITGKNQRDLSRVINEHYKMNFYEFINTYRIQKFKDLIQKDDHKNYTILFLAYESGFNSKATFNSAFKKITKLTPREYISGIES